MHEIQILNNVGFAQHYFESLIMKIYLTIWFFVNRG